MFGPLAFDEAKPSTSTSDCLTQCLLCEDCFNLQLSLPMFLKHIFDVHCIVIEDVQNVDNLSEYISFWRKKFKARPIEQIVPAVTITLTDTNYFVLSTLLKEDKELRHKLKLECMLKAQEDERIDKEYKRPCLFCKLNFEGTRYDYIGHLTKDHNIRLGNPQNLVYIDELIDKIEKKLELLQCLYCEKTFTDRNTLKEHMRKKQHKRINPVNQTYDKYYAVNYLNPDKKWHSSDRTRECQEEDNSDDQYEGWTEAAASIICLFCTHSETDADKLCLHMTSRHRFNFYVVTNHLDFYQKVKVVNYIRRQSHLLRCVYCNAEFEDSVSLTKHMEGEGHFVLPEVKVFDQPEYYFPTYENDAFLYFLEEIED